MNGAGVKKLEWWGYHAGGLAEKEVWRYLQAVWIQYINVRNGQTPNDSKDCTYA